MKSHLSPAVVSIVIAVYKNEKSIEPLFRRIESMSGKLDSHINLEVIFVIDGSPDRSLIEAKKLITASNQIEIKVYELSRNFGQLGAILAGLNKARGDAVINISADLQDPPELIEKMINSWQCGNEIVICARADREDSFFQRITSFIGYFFLSKGPHRVPKGGFDYFLISLAPLKHLLAMKGRFRFFQGDILGLGFPTALISYTREKRKYGKSSYTFSKRFQVFVDSLIDISYFPIKLITRAGILVSILGFILALVTALRFFQGHAPFNGFTALLCAILIFGGIQIISIGLMGEYLFRVYDMLRERPVFIIKD